MLLLLAAGVLCHVAYGLDTSQALNLYLGIVLYGIVVVTCTMTYFQGEPPGRPEWLPPPARCAVPLGCRAGRRAGLARLLLGRVVHDHQPPCPTPELVTNLRLGTAAERSTAGVMDAIKSMLASSCTVIREGKEQRINPVELVVGDLVRLGLGDRVPADLRIIFTADLKTASECPHQFTPPGREHSPATLHRALVRRARPFEPAALPRPIRRKRSCAYIQAIPAFPS